MATVYVVASKGIFKVDVPQQISTDLFNNLLDFWDYGDRVEYKYRKATP